MGLVLNSSPPLEAPLRHLEERIFLVPPRGHINPHPVEWKLLYFMRIEGLVTLEHEGKRIQLANGDLVVMPPSGQKIYYHNAMPKDPTQMHVFRVLFQPRTQLVRNRKQLRERFILDNFSQFQRKNALHSPDLISRVTRIRNELNDKAPGWELALNMAAWGFLISAARILNDLAHSTASDSKPRTLIVNRAREYIHKNYYRPITLGEIAMHVDRGEEHLAREFKKSFGMTVFQYLRKTRIEAAINLMADSSYPLRQIAALSGFNSLPFFSSCFRKATGKSPSAYRADLPHGVSVRYVWKGAADHFSG